jgi:hypothetical protein
MADFFRSQMDYIYFFTGLSFILLVPLCHFLNRRPQRLLPWVWLGLFGATHGVSEWLDLLALDLGGGPVLNAVRIILMTVSFIFLVEFGRAGMLALRRRSPGRWILWVLAGVALLGGLAGFSGLCAASRYSLGLVGGFWTAMVFYLASRNSGSGKLALRGAALGMAIFALAAGIVVSPASFFPASVFNATVFFKALGLPIQLIRGLLILWMSACICLLAQVSMAQEAESRIRVWGRTLMTGAAIGVIAALTVGWFITEYFSDEARRDVRVNQESHAKVLFRLMVDKME